MNCRQTMLTVLAGVVASIATATDVDVWLTRGDQASLLESRPALTFAPGSGTNGTKINVNSAVRYQSMDGFGASLTDSSAWLIENELTPAAAATLLEELFSPTTGLGLSTIRVPMGASDFALAPYTYDDMPTGQTDPALTQFSIAHDLAYIIPTLQTALAHNPQLKLFASPWSPPAWMKSSGTLFGGSFNTSYYSAYAQYFVKFVQAYEAEGVPFYAVTPQNEPLHDTSAVPSMSMPTYVQSTFVGDHLGPAFAGAGIDTKILVYDHNWDEWNYPIVVLNDPDVNQYAAGSSFHGYAGDVASQSSVHNYFPDKEIHFTEISGGDWAPNFADNLVWHFRNIIIGATRNWSRSVIYWNLALDENDGPYLPGGCDECRGVVTINTSSGQVTRNVEYYVLAHASKFVQPGAQRIDTDSLYDTIETVGLSNPDGSVVLIALNPSASSRWFDVLYAGEFFSYRLTGQSVATFVWSVSPPGDFDGSGVVDFDDIDDGIQANANSLYDYLGQTPPRPQDDLDDAGTSANTIDLADLYALVEQIIGSFVGDITRDYFVDNDDFVAFVAGMGASGGYFDGDLNGTLDVDLADFAVLQAQFSPQPDVANMITNPGFEDLNGDSSFGDGWGYWGDAGFGDYWIGNPHASLFADEPGKWGGVYQMGITGAAGVTYQLDLLNVRIEQNVDADFSFGLEFYQSDDATKISEAFISIDLGTKGDGLSFSMSTAAPAGTTFVRPVIRFDNVQSSAGTQENLFIFHASLQPLSASH